MEGGSKGGRRGETQDRGCGLGEMKFLSSGISEMVWLTFTKRKLELRSERLTADFRIGCVAEPA